MDLGKLKLFTSLTGRMDWLGNRQRVISQNIANANTPGYVPRDMTGPDFGSHLSSARALRMETSSPMHRTGTTPMTMGEKRGKDPYATTISGNSVDLDSELRKISETGMRYQMMINLYQKNIGLLKTAIGRTG